MSLNETGFFAPHIPAFKYPGPAQFGVFAFLLLYQVSIVVSSVFALS